MPPNDARSGRVCTAGARFLELVLSHGTLLTCTVPNARFAKQIGHTSPRLVGAGECRRSPFLSIFLPNHIPQGHYIDAAHWAAMRIER